MRLSVQNVGLSYGDKHVLSDVSFSLGDSEKVLLVGPSGSGKSSLLNIICGLQTPDRGATIIDGKSMQLVDDEIRKRHMGIIFQSLRLVSALNVWQNLTLAQRLQTGMIDEPLIEDTIERLGISDRAKARPFELSQGEAQRAAIARAVVVKPSILIADEPTSALDRANAERVAKLLVEASENVGASLLVATHDDRLTPYFERKLNLDHGKLVP